MAPAPNSLFTKWRPKSHFLGPNGWLNDPMALTVFDNGTYHFGYQYVSEACTNRALC